MVWSGIYDFILVIHSNQQRISHGGSDIYVDFGLKTPIVPALLFNASFEGITVWML